MGLQLTFKLADLMRYTSATEGQLQNWIRHGLLIPIKGSRSQGDPRRFSMLNLIEAAQLTEMARVGLTPMHMKLLFRAQQQQLAKVPAIYRPQCAWSNYVRQVMKDAELLGQTNDPRYVRWLRGVQRIRPRLEACKVAAPETQVLELLVAAQPRAQALEEPASA